MKHLLVAAFTIASFHCASQTKSDISKYKFTKEQKADMLKSIPVVDGKVKYDEVIIADSAVKREQLFIKIRQWFVENFTDSKAVLEVNDEDNGLLTGKGTYKYSTINGLNAHEGYTTFVINVAIKDGKFRYQLYSFNAEGTNTSMLGDANDSRKEKVSMDEMVQWYNQGKRQKYARKYLEGMLDLVYFIKMSLHDLANQKSSISDF